jgi:hypothetical protein
MASEPPRGRNQLVDLGRRQVLPGTPLVFVGLIGGAMD